MINDVQVVQVNKDSVLFCSNLTLSLFDVILLTSSFLPLYYLTLSCTQNDWCKFSVVFVYFYSIEI